MWELRRIMSEALDKSFDELKQNLDSMSEITDMTLKATYQRLAGAKYDARQPRLASEADVPTDEKTRKRVETAAADQAKHGDSCSAKRVDIGSTSSTSFGITARPLALPRRDDVLVDKNPWICAP